MTSRKTTLATRPRSPVRTALVVLGMHRSGTSALAGMLGHMGCDLPKHLMPPTEANPKGHFESSAAYQLNDALLASAGSAWDDWDAFNPDWYRSPRLPEYRQRAGEVIVDEFGASGFFVLKDPRICRMVPFWQEVLAEQGISPLFVCTHRDPREVAASLAHRDGLPEAEGLLLWLRHALDAEAGSRGAPRVFVSYDLLLSDWRETVGRIGTGLGLHWPRPVDNAAAEIEDFLAGDLRHFCAARDDAASKTALTGWVGQVWTVLSRWGAEGEDPGDYPLLDEIRQGLDAAVPTLKMVVDQMQQVLGKAAQLQTDLDGARAEVQSHAVNHATEQRNRAAAEQQAQDLSAALERTRAEAAERQAQLDAAQAARAGAEQRVAELSATLEQTRTEIAERQKHLTAVQAARAGSEQRVAELSAVLERTRAEAAERQKHLTAVQAARAGSEQRVAELSAALERTRAEAAERQAELAAAQAAGAGSEQQVAELSAALEQTRAEAAERQAELTAEQAARAGSEQQVAELSARIDESEDRFRGLSAEHLALEEELARQQQARMEAEQSADQLRSALTQRSQETDDLYRQRAGDREKLAELEATLTAIRADYADLTRRAERDALHLQDMTRRQTLFMQAQLTERMNQSMAAAEEERKQAALAAEYERKQAALAKDYEGRLGRLSEENDSLRQRLDDLTRRSAEERGALMAEIEQTRRAGDARLQELERQWQDAETGRVGLEAEMAQLREETAGRVAELEADLERQRQEAEAGRTGLEAELERRQHEMQERRAALEAEMAQQEEEARGRLAELEAEREEALSRADQARADLERRIFDLEQQIRALYESTSWRITGPLRRVSRALGR